MISVVVHQVLSVAKTSPFVPLFINSNSKVHNNALEGLVKTDAKYFDVNPTGIVINRFCKDAGSIDNFLIDNVNFLSYNGLVIIFAIMLAFIILPLMIIAFPVLVLLYFYGSLLLKETDYKTNLKKMTLYQSHKQIKTINFLPF